MELSLIKKEVFFFISVVPLLTHQLLPEILYTDIQNRGGSAKHSAGIHLKLLYGGLMAAYPVIKQQLGKRQTLTIIDRRPLAPVLRSRANLAIAFKASSVTFNSHCKT